MSGSTAPPDSRHPRAASAQVQARAALVRNRLREQVCERLCDGPAQARDMATTIRELWRCACA